MNNDLNDILDQSQLKERPFKVPEGYFDTLNTRIMQNITAYSEEEPVVQTKAKRVTMTAIRWAAACACALAIGTAVYHFTGNEQGDKQTAAVMATPQKDTATVIKQAIQSTAGAITAKVEEKVSQKATMAAEEAAKETVKTSAANALANNESISHKTTAKEVSDADAYEEAAEYAMLDNYEMYDLMTEE